MAKSKPIPWTRRDTLDVLALYQLIPFGKMHSKNPSVVALAKRLGRTPSSVAMKLVNFAGLDPEHQKRGVAGLSGATQLDRAIWAEFYGKWETLAKSQAVDIVPDVVPAFAADPYSTDLVTTATLRRGQQFFRRMVLAAYDHRCCITGISSPQLIRASHIVPWSERRASRLDPRNGLALNALHDAAFDRGLIAFNQDRRLILSRRLPANMPAATYKAFFGRYEGIPLQLPDRHAPTEEYLAFHREHRFAK